MTRIFNRPTEKRLRQRLRRNAPQAEVLLWSKLRGRQILGCKFRRQFSIGPYSVDFYCPLLRLAIEVDGDSHFEDNAMARDAGRQALIEGLGIQFLRFTNNDIYENLDDVMECNAQKVLELSGGRDPTLLSPSQGEG